MFSGFTGNQLSNCDALHTFGHPPANTNVLFDGFYSGGVHCFTTENQSKLIHVLSVFHDSESIVIVAKYILFVLFVGFLHLSWMDIRKAGKKRKQLCRLCWKHKGSFQECWH